MSLSFADAGGTANYKSGPIFNSGRIRSGSSGEDGFDEFAVDVGETEVASLEAEGEPPVVDS
jgi:hypothetical protein